MSDIKMEVKSKDEARDELSQLRSRRGGIVSKWKPFKEKFSDLDQGEAIVAEVGEYKNVSALRNYLQDKFGKDQVVVRSSSVDEDKTNYRVVITHPED